MTTRLRNLSRYHSHETAMAREGVWRSWYEKRGRGVGAASGPGGSFQDCPWWQSSLSYWLVEAGRIFLRDTTSKLIRELAYRLGKRLDD